MVETRTQRRLAAILAADVVGYSRLMGADEAGTLERLKSHRRELIDPKLAAHHGRLVKLMGDGALVEFASVVDAVGCAVEIQREMAARNAEVPSDKRIEFRIGINLGDVIVEGDDIYGDGVNVAARLEGLAEPGGICLSGDAYRQVKGRFEVGFEDLGEQRFKNIAEPVAAFRVRRENSAAPSSRVDHAPHLPDRPSIAVLPFANMSSDPEQEYFSDGVTEDIITELSRFRSLLVIARNSSFAFKGKSLKVQEIGRELGVAYVVEGGVRRSGDRLRLTAQLIETGSGAHIWAERYDRNVHDIFAVQDELAHAIAATVGARVQEAGREIATRLNPSALRAHELVLRAKAHALRYTRNDLEQALAMARQAIEIDPSSAQAHACYAYCCSVIIYSYWAADLDRLRVEAFEHAKRGVGLDPEDNYARWVLGFVHTIRREYEEAQIHLEKAVENNPNDTEARGFYVIYLIAVGEPEVALQEFDIIRRQNPFDLSWFPWIKGWACFSAHRYDDAIATLKRMSVPVNEVRGLMAASYAYAGRIAEAHAMMEEFLRVAESDMPVFPGRRLRDWDDYWQNATSYRRQEDQDHLMEGLRKAGLPE
jgi:adenylate cyclase